MMGKNLHVRVFFRPFAMAEYNVSLAGFAAAAEQAFGLSASGIVAFPKSPRA
jgi:hypothetical protein